MNDTPFMELIMYSISRVIIFTSDKSLSYIILIMEINSNGIFDKS